MSTYIHKSHNITALLYHLFPAKYRRAVIDADVDQVLKAVCLDIEKRYEIKFLEIGTDKDHVHFLVQSVPMYSVKKIAQMIKALRRGRCSGDALRSRSNYGAASFGLMGTLRVR